MKKIKYLILICVFISSVFAGFLYLGKEVIDKNKKIDILNKQINEDYFKKKIECNKYIDKIKENISESKNGLYASIFTENFEFIFYSPKDNSCLYATSVVEKIAGGGDREYFIYNTLTGSKITSFKFPDQFSDYKKFILDYSNGEIRL